MHLPDTPCVRGLLRISVLTGLVGTTLVLPSDEAWARRGAEPVTYGIQAVPLASVPVFTVEPSNVAALLLEDAELRKQGVKSMRYADPKGVIVTPQTHGLWETLADGSRLWRLRVLAAGATDLNFGFRRFQVPPGSALYVISESQDYYEGPYTDQDNAAHGELWTPVVPGDRAVLEIRVPGKDEPEIALVQVGYGYQDLFGTQTSGPKQGACNNDVICPEGDPWQAEIQSVAGYSTGGSIFCTGQMVMDVPGSFTPFFLTASHCNVTAIDAPSLVVYWNFHSPNCGDLCCGSLSDNQTGSTWRADRADVDFTLVELDELPDPGSNVYWSGWDATGGTPAGSVGIHHPSGDEKAISFNDDALTTVNSCIGAGTNTHWEVDNWEDGTTEPGSSGSGLWDPVSHLLVGTLSGGQASCTLNSYDCYGKFSVAWNGPSSATRLRDHLDPGDTGTLQVAGAYLGGGGGVILVDGSSLSDRCDDPMSNENGVPEPGERITLQVVLRALGGDMTGVTGVLSTTTSGITILDDTATWPDITSGTTQNSDDPHFEYDLDASVACASTLDFQLSVTSNEGGPWLFVLSEDVGESPVAADLPVAINDESTNTSTLTLTQNVTLTDVNVRVVIEHTFVGDLTIRLQSPALTTVTLLDQPGDILFSCGDDNMDVTFDDASGFDPDTHCEGTNPWYEGDASPVTPLSAFNGESSAGDWVLTVVDNVGGDTGMIQSWELLTTPDVATCENCNAVTAVSGAPTQVLLAQNQPNPFHSNTTIRFGILQEGSVSVRVFDVSGRLVRTLVDGSMLAGTYQVDWDGRNRAGQRVANGVYLYTLTTAKQHLVQRMSLLR